MNINDGKRRTIEEIIIRYKRSKEKTIYVEGLLDKSLFQWFLKQSNIKDIAVLDIQEVQIKKELIEKQKLEDNNRNRLIILTQLVQEGIIGIIDSDFDFIEVPTYIRPAHLLSADYSAIELYGFNENTLEKILLGYPSKQPYSYQELLTMLGDILVEIFLIRFAKKKIELNLPHICFNKNLFLKSNKITFDRDIYLNKYVSNQRAKITKFNNFIDEIKKDIPTDIKKIIHGHDFITLLQFYLEIRQEDAKKVFEKSFYSTLDFNLLKEEKMFRDLIEMIK